MQYNARQGKKGGDDWNVERHALALPGVPRLRGEGLDGIVVVAEAAGEAAGEPDPDHLECAHKVAARKHSGQSPVPSPKSPP